MPKRLSTPAELDAALAAPRYLLFKHSPSCPTSVSAFEEYETWARSHPDLATGWIEVVRERPLARAVAERVGVRHESPQVLLLEGGVATWNASHGAITVAALERALTSRRS